MYAATRRQVVYGPGKSISSGTVSTSVRHLSLLSLLTNPKLLFKLADDIVSFFFVIFSVVH